MAALARKSDKISAERPLPQAPVDNLGVGLYVRLPCSWLKHPFLKNSFKIKSAAHLAAIRALGLQRIEYDPDRSEPDAVETLLAKSALAPSRTIPTARQIDERQPSNAMPGAYRSKLTAEQLRVSQACKKDLTRAETVYEHTGRRSTAVVRDMAAGNEEAVTSGSLMIDAVTRWLTDSATSMGMINLLNFNGVSAGHTLHSLHVCIISMLVGRELGLDQEQLRCLGLGALVHDIGEHRVPSQVLYKTSPLNRAERSFLHLHPQYGVETVSHVPAFPAAGIDIIEQHHERLDGSGYPSRLRDGAISQLAKIVMVVDEYEEAINNAEASKNRTPTEALSHLYVHRQDKLPGDVIIALIQVLSVYPPGTLVELSDGSIGIVVTINFEAKVRPLVMLYEPEVSPDMPRVVNLAAEQPLSIERSLRPQDIAPQVVDYLNPRRMAGYFVTHSISSLNSMQAPVAR